MVVSASCASAAGDERVQLRAAAKLKAETGAVKGLWLLPRTFAVARVRLHLDNKGTSD